MVSGGFESQRSVCVAVWFAPGGRYLLSAAFTQRFTSVSIMRRYIALLLLALGANACADRAVPTEPSVAGSALRQPSLAIADAPRGFTPGFYWLPPMVNAPTLGGGTGDVAVSPTVEICELTGAACGPLLVTYTMSSGRGSETVRVSDRHYMVNWDTRDFDVSMSKRYRIQVRAGAGVLLGYADLQPVANAKVGKSVDTDEVIAFVVGQTLPIKFRIETGIVGQVSVTPAQASLVVGATQQFVASLRDLHGNPLSGAVTWAISNPVVAAIDASGLVTALGAGEAAIIATAGQVTGNATLTVTSPGLVSVSAGAVHSCALSATGRAYCWGLGSEGALGTGSTANQGTPAAVAGSLTFKSISAGSGHTCAVTAGAEAYCWGLYGPLGTGTTTNQLAPAKVAGGLAFASISAGMGYTCGVTTAGKPYCWGFQQVGLLGTGTPSRTRELTPAPVLGNLTFATISASRFHTCGVTTTGRAYCWGLQQSGELGTGLTTLEEHAPAPVAGNLTFVSISAGVGHTCGVTTGGGAYCWGANYDGELGTGLSTDVERTPALVAGGLTFTSIVAADNYTCGVTTNGRAYCWGWNFRGQLGDGTTTTSRTPVQVAGGLTFAGISAGAFHTCGVTTTGHAYCWGRAEHGELGNSQAGSVDQLTPVPVDPLP